ncbi:hypothetical protein DFH08DRAFT_807015 [Mycena albidolilacea]|uniref:Uncharacterized protein n=1 Tax=Mycena albidolilacea TaxID=1033008 RepID=A0AAD7A4Z4_9AGAR|nr:hypothetical protein DFH08DRAFT_807015 [Mycena albidolilacea]
MFDDLVTQGRIYSQPTEICISTTSYTGSFRAIPHLSRPICHLFLILFWLLPPSSITLIFPSHLYTDSWRRMIVWKFMNYRNCVYGKSATTTPTSALGSNFPLSQVDTICRTYLRRKFSSSIKSSCRPPSSIVLHHSVSWAGITVAPPLIVKHNNSPPPQLSTIQPPKFESGPTGPLNISHEQKIVNPELSESPSPPLRSPAPLPTPPSRQKGVIRKAKKQPELEGQKSTVDKMLNNLNSSRPVPAALYPIAETDHPQMQDYMHHGPVNQVKIRCKIEGKVLHIPQVWHKSELILFAVDLGVSIEHLLEYPVTDGLSQLYVIVINYKPV